MRYIETKDLEALAIGATLLGSGGGGDTAYALIRTKQLIEMHGPIQLLSVDELEDDALIVPIGYMGAPLVCIEKLPNALECRALLQSVERYFGKKVSALVAAEIGGSNAFTPLCVAAELGIPVVNGDTIGRAFPELQMSSCNVFGVSTAPAFIADCRGNVATLTCQNAAQVEMYFRALCTAMGSTAAICLYLMNGSQARKALIPHTLTRCIELGGDPLSHCKVIARGVISDVEQKIEEGFLCGKICIETASSQFLVEFQNEFLMVFEHDQVKAATPDIIALLDAETGLPLSVEQVKFGLKVDIAFLPCDPIWKTEKGLSLVGPEAFGYKGGVA